MNEQFPYRPDKSSDAGRDRPPAPTDQFAPIQRFPPEQFPTERFPTEQLPTRPAAGPVEPLAHEGGLPYGTTPAAPYRPEQDFVPQHLAAPPAFGNGPYGPGQYRPYLPQHLMPQPYPMQPYPMQQTVFVANGGGRRVNHVLHLILTILTFGLWLPVWAVLAIANS
ncbi:hypothetical protein ABIE38_002665 [Dietzia sp. 2505]|uniref:hypothetical protein n=1 Tax=Dietzia sp. 2505 TaxID=3156457 RepID=UPI003392FBBC